MKLWIVVNEFLRTEKFVELEHKFSAACNAHKIDYQIVTNAECTVTCSSDNILTGIIPHNNDPVLFWDKDIILAKALENQGHRLFNSSEAIATCDDKTLMAVKLAGKCIKIPRTIIAPMTYSGIGYTNIDFSTRVVDELGFPMIVKEAFGSFGKQVYMCNTYDELIAIINNSGDNRLLFQEYIKASSGRDIRMQVVGKEVVASMYRYSVTGDFRANISNGGHMKPYTPNQQEISLALEVTDALGLDFAGIDILFGDDDTPILCEANSNAHFKNIDDCTSSDVAYKIVEHIKNTFID